MSHEQFRAHVLSQTPHIAIVSNSVKGVVGSFLPGIVVGKDRPEGRIKINSDPDKLEDLGLTIPKFRVAVLAACGASNDIIATKLRLSQNTIKSHTHRIFSETSVANRRGMSRFFFQKKVFRIMEPIPPFNLEQRHCEFLTEVSYGIENGPAAGALAMTKQDTDRCVERIGRVMGSDGDMAAKILCAFASGEISLETPSRYLAAQEAEKTIS